MSIDRTIYRIYGLRLKDDVDQAALEEDPGHCINDGTVGFFHAGAHDRHMTFLALRWSTLAAGEYEYHSGEGPNEQRFIRERWNSDLLAVADRLGLEVTERPGWYTIPSED